MFNYTANLSYLNSYEYLCKEMSDHLTLLGKELKMRYENLNLEQRFSDRVIMSKIKKHKLVKDVDDSQLSYAMIMPHCPEVFDFLDHHP